MYMGGGFLSGSIFRECVFDSNSAGFFGGAFYSDDNSSWNTVSVVRCTLTHNSTPDETISGGGAIALWLARAVYIDSCLIRGNTSSQLGGGVLTYGGQYSFRNNIFEENHALWGGAMLGLDLDSTFISDCLFIANSADSGGGAIQLYWPEQAEIHNSIFEWNSTQGKGGAYLSQADTYIDSTLFIGNTAGDGAAIYFISPTSKAYRSPSWQADSRFEYLPRPIEKSTGITEKTLSNVTIVGNEASTDNIVYQGEGDLFINNSIIAFNGAGVPIHCVGNAITTASCTDIYGNAGGDWGGCVTGQEFLNDNFSANPLFCDTATGNFTLDQVSPCLDVPGCGLVGAYGKGCMIVTNAPAGAIDGEPFLQVGPNPMNSEVTIRLSPPRTRTTDIRIINIAGREVSVITIPGGSRSISWDGRSRAGIPLPAGVYFLVPPETAGRQPVRITLLR